MASARAQRYLWIFALATGAGGCGDAALPAGQGQADSGAAPGDATALAADALLPAPDAPVMADLAVPLDASPSDPAPPDAAAADAAGATSACTTCYHEAIGNSMCKLARPGACDEIPADGVGVKKSAGDRALCQALDDCMRTTGCWTTERGVADCLCGTAAGLACTTAAANGACKAPILAATKTANELEAGTLVFSTNVPSGFAAQKYSCYRTSCLGVCK